MLGVGTRWSLGLVVALIGLVLSSPVHAESLTWQDIGNERGVVVLMRHALAPGGGDPPGFRLSDCRTQRNLSSAGRKQARAIGRSIAASGADVSAIVSSPWCRAKDTAALLDVGSVRTLRYLGSTFTAPSSVADVRAARTRRLIESHDGERGLLIIVGHYANIIDLTGEATGSGEGIAVRMRSDGDLEILGRIPAEDP